MTGILEIVPSGRYLSERPATQFPSEYNTSIGAITTIETLPCIEIKLIQVRLDGSDNEGIYCLVNTLPELITSI